MKKALILCIKLLIISQLATAQSVTLATTTNNPSKGTVYFNNSTNQLQYWNGTEWIPITNAAIATGWGVSGNNIYNANTENLGIGTTTPKATFNVAAGKTVLFGADTSGNGNKFIWYSTLGALRAGAVGSPTWWNYSNVGIYSVALGIGTRASGNYSTSLGAYNVASETFSTAMGFSTTASGNASTAMGSATTASGSSSTAMGAYNIDVSNALLMVGNGTADYAKSNAITVLTNGKTGIGTTAPQEALHVQGSAIISSYLGIGTTSPIAPLHITTSNSLNNTTNHYFSWATGTTIGTLGDGNHNIGILAEYDIVTKNSFVSSQTVTTSDARIKNIVGLSNNQQDLATLKQIKITDYHYKDAITWGNQTFKKVIAQQVEEIFPQAVRKQTSTIPDIYSLSEKVVFDEINKKLTISLLKTYDIKTGDKIELIDEKNNKQLAEVENVDGKNFTVKNWITPTNKVFVFGKQVNDFRVVDYEAISMLGISAIQELAKQNDELKLKVKQLESNFATRIEVLEEMVLKPR